MKRLCLAVGKIAILIYASVVVGALASPPDPRWHGIATLSIGASAAVAYLAGLWSGRRCSAEPQLESDQQERDG